MYNTTMSYPTQTREMALKFVDAYGYNAVHDITGIAISTLENWKKQKAETGSLEPKEIVRSARKFHDDQLREYM